MAVSQVSLNRTRERWTLFVSSMSQLLVTVDVTVVNIMMPSAQHDLGMSDASKQWMISAYTLTFGGFLLLGGRVGDRFGRRRSLVIALSGFAMASAAIGAAFNPTMLIVARAAQGMFAALLAPIGLSLLTVTFTNGPERSRALAVLGTVTMSGGIIGLVAGGVLTQFLGWRWCMYVQVPLALVVAVIGFLVLPVSSGERTGRLDWLSALACTAGVAALVYGLSQTVVDGWNSAYVVGSISLSLIMLVGFVLRQKRLRNPLLPLAIFSSRVRTSSYLAIGLLAFSLFGVWVFLTYQLQQVMGFSPLLSGLAFIPMLIGNLTGNSVIGGRLMRWASLRQLLAFRLVVAACGLVLLTQLTPDTSYWAVILPAEFLLGFGAGLAMPAVMDSAMGGVAPQDSGIASALFQSSNMLGASLGTAFLTTIAVGVTTATPDPHATTSVSHGYAVASVYATGVLVAGAVIIGIFLRGSGRRNGTASRSVSSA